MSFIPSPQGLDAGFVGRQAPEETIKNFLLAYLQGAPIWVVEGLLWPLGSENAWAAHVPSPSYLSPMCQENVDTRLQSVNLEAADLWRSWITQGGYPRPSRESSAEAVQWTVNGKQVWVTSGSEAVCAWCLVGQIPNSFPPDSSHHRWAVWTWRNWLWSRLPSEKHCILVVNPSERVPETSSVAVPLSVFKKYMCKTNFYILLLVYVWYAHFSLYLNQSTLWSKDLLFYAHLMVAFGYSCMCLCATQCAFWKGFWVSSSLWSLCKPLSIPATFSFWLFRSLFVTIRETAN